ncbi:MAG: guanylate kinase [Pirellulaceae bacterium]|nr:guanylate kinase [Planctomycetaceae bacterium]HIM31394.1 guanylate kinase [Planctomycetota bacterium]
MKNELTGQLVIVSGPSGAGKSSVLERLLTRSPLPLQLSISVTTRSPRPSEQDGRDYIFIDHEDFVSRREAGEFLECMEVFGRGHWYGTLRQTVEEGLEAGKWVVLEIDVHGMLLVTEQMPLALTIFLHPGSLAELEDRLRKRGTEDEKDLQRRLEVARKELEYLPRYRFEVINDTIDRAVDEISAILLGEREHVG